MEIVVLCHKMDATTKRMPTWSILSKLPFINDQRKTKFFFFIFRRVLCHKAMIHSNPCVIIKKKCT